MCIRDRFYIGNYVFEIFKNPTLELRKPVQIFANESGNFVTEENTVQLEGISEIGNKLSINGQEYRVNSFEQFTVELRLEEGLNEIIISSKNQINRTSEIVLNVLYDKKNQMCIRDSFCVCCCVSSQRILE